VRCCPIREEELDTPGEGAETETSAPGQGEKVTGSVLSSSLPHVSRTACMSSACQRPKRMVWLEITPAEYDAAIASPQAAQQLGAYVREVLADRLGHPIGDEGTTDREREG